MDDLRIDMEEFEEKSERNQSKIRILEQTEATIRKRPQNNMMTCLCICLLLSLYLPAFVFVFACFCLCRHVVAFVFVLEFESQADGCDNQEPQKIFFEDIDEDLKNPMMRICSQNWF